MRNDFRPFANGYSTASPFSDFEMPGFPKHTSLKRNLFYKYFLVLTANSCVFLLRALAIKVILEMLVDFYLNYVLQG